MTKSNMIVQSHLNDSYYESFKQRIQELSLQLIVECAFKDSIIKNDGIGRPYKLNNKEGKETILIMGINPAGSKIDDDKYLCIVPGLELPNNKYGYPKYYGPNYDLVKELNVGMYWSSYDNEDDYPNEEELPGFKVKLEAEKKDKRYYLIFSNIMYIHETSSEKLKSVLIKEELNNKLKELLETQIEYYNPKYFIVTNAWVSDKIHEIYEIEKGRNEDIKNGVHYIFSGFVSSGRLDKYNMQRLKNDIHKIIK